MFAKNKRLVVILFFAFLLLLVPLIAMQFTNEVQWKLGDFIVAGFLLFGTGFLCEFVLRKVSNKKYRIAICAILIVALLLTWIELAVGIFGTAFAGT